MFISKDWGMKEEHDTRCFIDCYLALPLSLGHTFTEILTFRPVVPESKETQL